MAAKYQIVADSLRAHIQTGKYADAAALPTEFAIAREYQVSRQTVRQALAMLSREGLIATRQGSGSRILRQARETAAGQRRSIAVISTYISDYIFPGILREVETVLSQHGCTPSLFATQNQVSNERRILTQLLQQPVDGILVEATKSALPNPNLDLYQLLMDREVPLVFIHGCYANLPGAHFVMDDNAGGGRQLVRYLADKGYERVGGIFKSDDIQGHGRYAGYTGGLQEKGLPLKDQYVYWYNTETKASFLSGGDASIRAFLDRALEEVEAFVCYNDEIANSLLLQLQKRGLRVPEDIAIVSFDNSFYSELSPVPITSLSHGGENAGRTAAQTLLRQMAGEYCQSVQLPWVLVERESSRLSRPPKSSI
ncbi:MAG: substrate-binding domain-containing protein [Oscillibacter sp.]|nr:substrate-binding domain-containing protein [Oscillibacter sp.]